MYNTVLQLRVLNVIFFLYSRYSVTLCVLFQENENKEYKELKKIHYWSNVPVITFASLRLPLLHQGRFAQREHTDNKLNNESSFRSANTE